jgi:hypothetical protein
MVMARRHCRLALIAVLGAGSFGPIPWNARAGIAGDDGPATLARARAHAGDALVSLRLLTNGLLSERQVQELRREVEGIWAPHGVRVEWREPSHGSKQPSPLHLIVSLVAGDAASKRLASLHVRTPFSHDPPCDGNGALIRVSVARASLVVTDAFQHQQYVARAALASARLPVFIGRVVAHEMGHYLLDDGEHAARGLMRPQYRAHDVVARREEFGLDAAQLARLRALSDQRQAAQLLASNTGVPAGCTQVSRGEGILLPFPHGRVHGHALTVSARRTPRSATSSSRTTPAGTQVPAQPGLATKR